MVRVPLLNGKEVGSTIGYFLETRARVEKSWRHRYKLFSLRFNLQFPQFLAYFSALHVPNQSKNYITVV